MNSFSTSEDTLSFLKKKYPDLAGEDGLELLQNKVPKIDATTFEVRICNALFEIFPRTHTYSLFVNALITPTMSARNLCFQPRE